MILLNNIFKRKKQYKSKLVFLVLFWFSILLISFLLSVIYNIFIAGIFFIFWLFVFIIIPFISILIDKKSENKYKMFLFYFPVFLFYIFLLFEFTDLVFIDSNSSIYIDYLIIQIWDLLNSKIVDFIYLFYWALLWSFSTFLFKDDSKIKKEEKEIFYPIIWIITVVLLLQYIYPIILNNYLWKNKIDNYKYCFSLFERDKTNFDEKTSDITRCFENKKRQNSLEKKQILKINP